MIGAMFDGRSHSDAKSQRSYRTRSEVSGSAVSSLSEARRRAALSKLQAEQAQRAATAKAELARQQAAAQAEAARQQAEAQAAVEVQALKDEAERCQLELELLEQEERASLPPGSSAASQARGPAAVPTEPPVRPCSSVARTKEWLAQSQLHVQPDGAALIETAPAPAQQLAHPSGDTARAMPQLPRITIEKFGGSALEWPRWVSLFKALVHDRADLTDVERLTYLQAHLTGPAREAVRGMLCDASLYSTALGELEREFGDPARVIHATMKRLLTARPVKDGDMTALTELSRDLHTAVNVLQCLHYDSDISAATNVTTVAGKLPAGMAWRWGEHVVERGITRPTLADLNDWLRRQVAAGRVAAMDQTGPRKAKVEASGGPPEGRPKRVFATASAPMTRGRAVNSERPKTIKPTTVGRRDACAMCGRDHSVQCCEQFIALTIDERAEFIGLRELCFNCLERGHVSARCPRDVTCDVEGCGRRHNSLLHGGRRVFPRAPGSGGLPAPSDTKHVGTAAADPRSQVLLQVTPITVQGPSGTIVTHALLDLGSQVTLITDELCDRLGVSGPTDGLVLSTLNGNERLQSRRVTFSVQPVGGEELYVIRDAQTTPKLNVANHSMDWSREKDKWPHLRELNLPSVCRGPVDVLLGSDAFELIVPREVVEGPPGTPCAVRTRLGWTVTGRVPRRSPYMQDGQSVHHVRVDDERSRVLELHNQMKRFWTTEDFGTKYEKALLRSDADVRAMSILDSTTRRAGDRYETGLLWRDDDVRMPDNRETALIRLRGVERRLARDERLCQSYRETVNDYITQGHASKVIEGEPEADGRTWYLPHHAVQNPNKPGKVRVVFDAAAKCDGTSLNDNLISGPNNLNSLPGVLMRFRQGRVPVASDVKQMFHQITIRPQDRRSQRFLWRDMDTQREPETYQMNVVIFGAKSSPLTATYELRRCAEDGRENTLKRQTE